MLHTLPRPGSGLQTLPETGSVLLASVAASPATPDPAVFADAVARYRALERLREFRSRLYDCLARRADALFELTDAVLCADHAVTSLVHGVNLRLLDWLLFTATGPRELGALYEDCRECNASTFFTAFYYDVRVHGWGARWMRGEQAAPLSVAIAPAGVSVTNVYALLADPNGHELLATWSHFDYGKQKPAEDYLYQYDSDPWSRVDRTQLVANKDAETMKHRLCSVTEAVAGLAHGQDSDLCRDLLDSQGARHRGRAAVR